MIRWVGKWNSPVNLRFDLPQIAKEGFSSKYRPDNCPKQHTKSPKKILHGKAVKMNLIDTRALLRHENEAGTENIVFKGLYTFIFTKFRYIF